MQQLGQNLVLLLFLVTIFQKLKTVNPPHFCSKGMVGDYAAGTCCPPGVTAPPHHAPLAISKTCPPAGECSAMVSAHKLSKRCPHHAAPVAFTASHWAFSGLGGLCPLIAVLVAVPSLLLWWCFPQVSHMKNGDNGEEGGGRISWQDVNPITTWGKMYRQIRASTFQTQIVLYVVLMQICWQCFFTQIHDFEVEVPVGFLQSSLTA